MICCDSFLAFSDVVLSLMIRMTGSVFDFRQVNPFCLKFYLYTIAVVYTGILVFVHDLLQDIININAAEVQPCFSNIIFRIDSAQFRAFFGLSGPGVTGTMQYPQEHPVRNATADISRLRCLHLRSRICTLHFRNNIHFSHRGSGIGATIFQRTSAMPGTKKDWIRISLSLLQHIIGHCKPVCIPRQTWNRLTDDCQSVNIRVNNKPTSALCVTTASEISFKCSGRGSGLCGKMPKEYNKARQPPQHPMHEAIPV